MWSYKLIMSERWRMAGFGEDSCFQCETVRRDRSDAGVAVMSELELRRRDNGGGSGLARGVSAVGLPQLDGIALGVVQASEAAVWVRLRVDLDGDAGGT